MMTMKKEKYMTWCLKSTKNTCQKRRMMGTFMISPQVSIREREFLGVSTGLYTIEEVVLAAQPPIILPPKPKPPLMAPPPESAPLCLVMRQKKTSMMRG